MEGAPWVGPPTWAEPPGLRAPSVTWPPWLRTSPIELLPEGRAGRTEPSPEWWLRPFREPLWLLLLLLTEPLREWCEERSCATPEGRLWELLWLLTELLELRPEWLMLPELGVWREDELEL